mmetsp:Transcript_134/g.351  ORF Transcript_134/g.351 Transcript_134/m.351 type:complete len:232 (+) Transcript_134:1004-1699(+)
MADADVLHRTTRTVHKRLVDALHDVHAFRHLAKDGVLAVERVEALAGGDEELAGVHILARARHGQQPLTAMLELLADLIVEESGLVAVKHAVDGGAARASGGGVTRLDDEVLDHLVEQAVVVVLDFAQLEEVLRRQRALFRVEVHCDIPAAGLQQHRHRAAAPRLKAAVLLPATSRQHAGAGVRSRGGGADGCDCGYDGCSPLHRWRQSLRTRLLDTAAGARRCSCWCLNL